VQSEDLKNNSRQTKEKKSEKIYFLYDYQKVKEKQT